jgi:hypothetical protein
VGTITHTTQATGANDPSKQVSKDAWNAEHTFSLTGADLGSNPTLTGTAIAEGFNATTGVYKLNGGNFIYVAAGIYTTICDPASADKIYIGAAGDPTTYIRNSTVKLQTIGANDFLVATTNSVQIPLVPLELGAVTAPAAPAAGYVRIYFDTADSQLKAKNAAGAVVALTAFP